MGGLSVSSCLPAHRCQPARSFMHGLSVKALKLVVITKASVDMGVLAELGKRCVCCRTQSQSWRKGGLYFSSLEPPAAWPWVRAGGPAGTVG